MSNAIKDFAKKIKTVSKLIENHAKLSEIYNVDVIQEQVVDKYAHITTPKRPKKRRRFYDWREYDEVEAYFRATRGPNFNEDEAKAFHKRHLMNPTGYYK